MNHWKNEVSQKTRFQFGKNWSNFLSVLDDERIIEAEKSLKNMLRVESLEGKRFLDIGSGSGLFSLAARRLGAQVHSFDYDPDSVECARELKRRYYPNDRGWIIEQGSALDKGYLSSLGQFDIVYSWGVLHHTGDMWTALDNVHSLVAPHGKLFISIYNDQGLKSRLWRRVKRAYCANALGKCGAIAVFVPYFFLGCFVADIARGKNPLKRFSDYKKRRGMSVVHDWIDWLGGYPFEVATPGEIVYFFIMRGFSMKNLKTCGGKLGCNEFVFEKW